jgi:tRNA-binding protein
MTRREILIVEDEEITALDLEATLTRLGYRVTAIAVSGEEAIALVARQPPDLVLMDIQLRGNMDGIMAARTIHRIFSLPIIYLTAHNDPLSLGRASQTPPFGYIVKPFEEQTLRNTIEIALHRADSVRQATEAVNPPLSNPPPTEEALLQAMHSQFMANTFHAFRTPLSKILLATDALEQSFQDRQATMDEETRRRFCLIKDSITQLTTLLERTVSSERPPAQYCDFEKLEIRVGQVQRVEEFPEARRPAYKLWIDFGELGLKKSSAQVTALYTPEDLVQRQVLAVTNFPPRQIANFMSEVLVLGVVLEDGAVALVQPDRHVPLGARLL